jgi:nucleotide-binding universal stress UspA family protein
VAMIPSDVVALIGDDLMSRYTNERRKLDRIDRWARWEHDEPHRPRQATREYQELANRAQAPWGDLIVGSVAQTLYVEGYRRPDVPEDSNGWDLWQANGMDARQVAMHRSVLTYGLTYGFCLPGVTMTGQSLPVMRAASPREMYAVYDDPANDDWPMYALRVQVYGDGFRMWLFDSELVHELSIDNVGDVPKYDGFIEHGVIVPPVVRYKNRFDLEGRSTGEIEPFIPVLGKIDQTSFDRLVVQRFASWIVRTIAGMSIDETIQATGETAASAKLRLKVEDILVAEDADTKFGSLPATSLNGFIDAHEADLKVLASVSQTPAFELVGQMANLSAEALEAARASQTAKSEERRVTLGENHEQFIRLACLMAGDIEGAEDFRAQVRWKDTAIRSMAQAADALGKLTQMLGVPAQVLWPKIPGFTQQDVDEAKDMAQRAPSPESFFAAMPDIERQLQVPPA